METRRSVSFRLSAIAAVLLLLVGSAIGASPTTYPVRQNTDQFRIKPQAMPTTLTVVTASDSDLIGLVVINPTGGAISALVQDGQGTPIPLLGTTSIAANSTTIINVPFGYWCPSGFSVQALGSGLTYYAIWKQ